MGSRISVGRTGGAPFVAFDGTNYLLVWADFANQCDNKCEVIYGQLISKSGTLIGSPFPISPEAGNNMESKGFGRIIFDGTNYFVAWDLEPNGPTDAYGQFVTPSGTLLGQPIKINTTNSGGGGVTVAFDGTNILVAWGSEWNASGTQSVCWTDSSGYHCDIANIWGQFITKSSAGTPGTLSGSNFLISAASVLCYNPSIAFDGTNYLVILAQETTRPDTCPSSGCKWDIYGQLVTKAGAPIGSRITISDTSPNHSPLALSVFNGTNYLVTWTEGFGSTEATVKGRFFDKSGGPVGSEFALFSPSGGRVPWAVFTLFDGSKYFSVINRGTPGIDPYNEDAYTNEDVFGAFINPFESSPISPDEGTIGTEMAIKGSGFGTTKGKILIGNVTPKILEWTDSSIRCQLVKSPPLGTYDVTIQPKGASPIVIESGFTIAVPEIDSVEPSSGTANKQITVTGFYFGTKKGKVLLEGKNCKVASWMMAPSTGESEIQFIVPKGISSGVHEMEVINGMGSGTVNFTID